MFGRRPARAVETFVASLQRAVSCVTPAILIRKPTASAGSPALGLAAEPARLRGDRAFDLIVLIEYAVAEARNGSGQWTVHVAGYRYEFRLADGPMLLAYHWHPVGVSPIMSPHLHIGGSVRNVDLSKRHLPTGHVTLQDVLRFAVVDLGVAPLRDDWQAVLASPSPGES